MGPPWRALPFNRGALGEPQPPSRSSSVSSLLPPRPERRPRALTCRPTSALRAASDAHLAGGCGPLNTWSTWVSRRRREPVPVLKEIDVASLLTPGPARRRGAQPPAAPEPVHPRACSRAVPGAASPRRCRRDVAARSASHCLCQRHPRSREGDRRDECAACEPGASSGRGVSARSSRAPTGALAGAPDVVRAQQRSKGKDWVPPLRPSKPPKKPPNPGRSGGSVGTPPPAGPTPRPEGCQCWTERRKGWVASSTRTPVNSSRHPVLDRAGKGMAVACPHRRRRSQPSMRLARGQSRGRARWDCRALARRPPHPSRCPRPRPATAWSKS